jgi:IS30 family transposase
VIGKLRARTKEHTNQRTIRLMRRHPQRFKTITADNGTEFHDYTQLERATGVAFYFATPHHSWERGTNENTNGLIRQYVPRAPAWPSSLSTLQRHRSSSEQPTAQTTRLQNPSGVLQ